MATKTKTPKKRPARSAPVAATDSLADIRAAKQEWSKRLLARPSRLASHALTAAISPDPDVNLVGVGIGEKIVDGRRTGVMCVKLLVRAKFHDEYIDKKHMLPKSIDGIPVDVEEMGPFRRLAAPAATTPNPRGRVRPAQPGCSVGFDDSTGLKAGTFGALVQDANGIYILSNNHVLADEGQLPLNAPIYQPAFLDGGTPKTDQIARLTHFEPLTPDLANQVDCAVAAVLNPADASNAILQIGPPRGAGEPKFCTIVHKFGRSTRYTVGHIDGVEFDTPVTLETGTYAFIGQILVTSLDDRPFADSGDSGALILERDTNVAVGLLFAGESGTGLANRISVVLNKLKVKLVP